MSTELAYHDQWRDFAATALDFELTADERGDLLDHLAGCPACRAWAAELTTDAAVLRDLPRFDAPARVRAGILAPRRSTWSFRLSLLAAMLGVVVVGVGVFVRTGGFPLGGSSAAIAEPTPAPTGVAAASSAPEPPPPEASAAPTLEPPASGGGGNTLGPTPGPGETVTPSTPAAWAALPPQPAFEDAVPHFDIDAAGAPPNSTAMRSVTAVPSGLIAVGHGCAIDVEGWHCLARVWTSREGLLWDLASDDPALDAGIGHDGDEPGGMTAVTTGGPGLVAGGWIVTGDRSRATVWTSTDGEQWSRIDSLPDRAGARIHGIAAAGSTIVTVGDAAGDGAARAAAWVSIGGSDWSSAVINGAANGRMDAVIPLDDGFLAVGAECDADGACVAASWRSSADGRSWNRNAADPAQRGRMLDVAQLEQPGATNVGTLVAVGEEPDGRAAAWTSTDGLTWTATEIESAKPLNAALVVDGVLLATGFRPVTAGRETTSVAAAWTGGSSTWTVSGRAIPGAMFDLVTGGPGVVAVGFDPEPANAAVSVLPGLP